MTEERILIKAKEIKKSYRITKTNTLNVLKGVNLDIYKGEIVAIIGKSGAGKSTLLHILGALDKPDSGEIEFEGNNIFSFNNRLLAEFRNKKIGFIFQFHHLLPEFTLLENVLIPNFIAGENNKERAVELLEVVGISERKSHKPSEI